MSSLEKVPETKEGLETLYDTTTGATDDRLVAGIQCKRTKKEDILKVTARLRDSRSTLEAEMLRLSDFAQEFNHLYATKNNKWFSSAEIMLKKIKSHYLRWREMLKFTSPRKGKKKNGRKVKEHTIYETTSFNKKRPYEKDVFGIESYGELVFNLKKELEEFLSDLVKGILLCQSMLNEEEIIMQSPEWIKEIYEDCYNMTVQKSKETIEWLNSIGRAHTDNPLYQLMLTYDNKDKFIEEQFHKQTDVRFNDYVIVDIIMTLRNNNISYTEQKLWGKNYDKIKLVRFAIENFDQLVTPHGRKGYDGNDIMEFILWCDVNKSIDTREDEEHILYDYLKQNYKGTTPIVVWSSVFEARKLYPNDKNQLDNIKMEFDEKVKKIYENIVQGK